MKFMDYKNEWSNDTEDAIIQMLNEHADKLSALKQQLNEKK